jgi:hypothetical protein
VWAFSKEDAQKKFGGWSINRGWKNRLAW